MTFRQLKASVKLRRTLILCSMVMITIGLAMFMMLMRNFSFTTTSLATGAVAYGLSMAGGLTIFLSLNYNKKHTKCIKCKRQIDMADFMNMDNFKCPHCNFEADADAKLW